MCVLLIIMYFIIQHFIMVVEKRPCSHGNSHGNIFIQFQISKILKTTVVHRYPEKVVVNPYLCIHGLVSLFLSSPAALMTFRRCYRKASNIRALQTEARLIGPQM